MTPSGRRIEIRGIVQGVEFRPFVDQIARRFGIGGRNETRAEAVVAELAGRGVVVEPRSTRRVGRELS